MVDKKKRGELAELAFLFRAASLGFAVAKPHGESERYDFLVDNGRRCWRVQVKAAGKTHSKNIYHINSGRHVLFEGRAGGKAIPYRKGEIDFLVVFIIPEATWYIVPFKALQGRLGLRIHSRRHANRGNCGEWEEAWHLMWKGGRKSKRNRTIERIQACAEEDLVWLVVGNGVWLLPRGEVAFAGAE